MVFKGNNKKSIMREIHRGNKKIQTRALNIFLCLGCFLLFQSPKNYSRFLTVVFEKVTNEEDVSPEVEEAQKQARIQAECSKILPPPQIWGMEHEDSHVTELSCVYTHYRIPRASVQNIEESMVFGILSHGTKGRSERDTVRETWGKGQKLFFLVAGEWDSIVDEYNELGDLIWVDQEEKYREGIRPTKGALTFKTQVFFAAMHDVVMKENPNVKYFFKTDTDSYINVNLVENEIDTESKKGPVNYWGRCFEHLKPYRDNPGHYWHVAYEDFPYTYYPKFCVGHGYFVSRKFLDCAVGESQMAKVPFLTNEDGATGVIAERCNMEPNVNQRMSLTLFPDADAANSIAIQTNVDSEELMREIHAKV